MLDKLINLAYKENVEAEVFFVKTDTIEAGFENNKFKIVESKTTEGIGLRVKYQNKVGFAATNNLKENNIVNFFKKAISLAKINNENLHVSFSTDNIGHISYISKKISEVTSSQLVEESKFLLDNTLMQLQKRGIDVVISGGIKKLTQAVKIQNTNGVESSYSKSLISKMIYGKASNIPSLECETVDFNSLTTGRDVEDLSEEFRNKIEISLRPKETSTLKNKLIFHPKVLAEILYYTLGSGISGENISRKKSFLVNKIGEKIASEKVTLIDWGDNMEFIAARPLDGEGTPTRKNILIDKGVLIKPIYDIEWGNRTGNKTTGNAHRDYTTTPSIKLNSLCFESTSSKNELLEELNDGYYVES
ncbi:MAG: TldD/PmbA family protein, partial [Candidatus Odinarchaeia archaeon]